MMEKKGVIEDGTTPILPDKPPESRVKAAEQNDIATPLDVDINKVLTDIVTANLSNK